MTAISGIWHFDHRPGALARVQRMQAALYPYGRDRTDCWGGDAIALGCSITRVVPEDDADAQPLRGGAGRFTLVADLRIDNRADLVRRLNLVPERAAFMADADLLLAGHERWGAAVVNHLVGPFCFAIWDEAEHSLTLARDHIGCRALYFYAGPRWFAFSSMPAGLFALPDMPMQPDETRLRNLLLLAVSGPDSFFVGLKGLEKGKIMTIRADGTISTARYWDPQSIPMLAFRNPDDYVEGLRDALTTATRSMLRSRKPIGATLSAGYDSSAVTVTAARLLAERDMTLTAFTAVPRPGFSRPERAGHLYDEGPIAAITAARYPNINHHRVSIGDGAVARLLDDQFDLAHYPILNLVNMLWLHEIMRRAQDAGIGTLLTATAGNLTISYRGDEYFYELFLAGRWLELARGIRSLQRERGFNRGQAIRRLARWTLGEAAWQRLRRLAQKPPMDSADQVPDWVAMNQARFASAETQAYLNRSKIDLRFPPRPATRQARCRRLRPTNAECHAQKSALAAYGVDTRDPTRDLRVVEFCFGVPSREHFRGGRFRGLFRAAFAESLPPEVIESQKKGMQGADWHEVLRAALPSFQHELDRMSDHPAAARLFDLERLQAAIDAYPEAADYGEAATRQLNLMLARGICALHFLRRASNLN